MTPTCLNARSAASGHASDKPTDCPKIDILPDLNQGVGLEVVDCVDPWCPRDDQWEPGPENVLAVNYVNAPIL